MSGIRCFWLVQMLHNITEITPKHTTYSIQYRKVHGFPQLVIRYRHLISLFLPCFALVSSNHNNTDTLSCQWIVANFAIEP